MGVLRFCQILITKKKVLSQIRQQKTHRGVIKKLYVHICKGYPDSVNPQRGHPDSTNSHRGAIHILLLILGEVAYQDFAGENGKASKT